MKAFKGDRRRRDMKFLQTGKRMTMASTCKTSAEALAMAISATVFSQKLPELNLQTTWKETHQT